MHFDVFAKDLDLDSSYFLEANAGCGKTFTIEIFFLRLLVEKKIPIEKILIVTFTIKATQEIKDRIYEMLRRYLTLCKADVHQMPPWMQPIDKNQMHSCLQQAILHIDRATIFTIHSFCKEMLSRFHLHPLADFGVVSYPDHPKDFFLGYLTKKIMTLAQLRRGLHLFCYDLSLIDTIFIRASDESLDDLEMIQKRCQRLSDNLDILCKKRNYQKKEVIEDFMSLAHCYRGVYLKGKLIDKKKKAVVIFADLLERACWSEQST